jgi:hypothetical protein
MKKTNFFLLLFLLFCKMGDAQQLNWNVLINSPLCFGQVGSINVSTNAISPVYTLVGNGMNSISTSGNFNALSPGVYTIVTTDAFNNSASTVAILFQPTPLMASIVSNIPATSATANNASVTYTASGGTFPIYPQDFQSAAGSVNIGTSLPDVINNLPGGTVYTVTVEDNNGCTASTLVTTTIANSCGNLSNGFPLQLVSVTPAPTTYVPNSNTPNGQGVMLSLCANQTSVFQVPTALQGAGLTYNWQVDYVSQGVSTSPNFTLNPVQLFTSNNPSYHFVSVNVFCNGSLYYSKQDTILFDTTCMAGNTPINVFSIFTNNGCGASADKIIIADAANYTAPISFSILPNVGIQSAPGEFTNLPSGTYIITGTDANMMTASTIVTVANVSPVIVTATSNNVCAGSNTPLVATAVANGGTAPYSIDWYSHVQGWIQVGSGNTYSPGLVPDYLEVRVEDANGCIDTAMIYIKYAQPSNNPPVNITNCLTYTLPWGQAVASSGTYSHLYTNVAGCDSNVVYNVTITGVTLTAKVYLHNASIAIATNQVPLTFTLMRDDLRTSGLIPLSSPYTLNTTTNPYAPRFTMVNAPTETTTAAVLAVTGANAIVDWVFVELRKKSNSSIVQYTRSALVQRDGDIVDMDGVSPVKFCAANVDSYYVAVRHRNHLGVMVSAPRYFNNTASIDFTNTTTGLFTKPSPLNNPAPFTGSTEVKYGKRFLYGANCGILTAAESKTVTYNPLPTSDRTRLFGFTGNTSTINGYSVFDVNFDGLARFNGLNSDRVTISTMVNGSSTFIINEQLP